MNLFRVRIPAYQTDKVRGFNLVSGQETGVKNILYWDLSHSAKNMLRLSHCEIWKCANRRKVQVHEEMRQNVEMFYAKSHNVEIELKFLCCAGFHDHRWEVVSPSRFLSKLTLQLFETDFLSPTNYYRHAVSDSPPQ